MSKVEDYVRLRSQADALYRELSAEDKAQAEQGLAWARVLGGQSLGAPKRRGRPTGSRNRVNANGADGVQTMPPAA